MKDFLNKLKGDKNITRLIFIIGTAGILIIFFSSFTDSSKKADYSSEDMTVAQYGEIQEDKLCEMIQKLEGAGKAEVMLTMENSAEQIYSKEYRVKAIEPKVRGVAVVCQGAADNEVKASIMELVTKTLNVTADKVCITKLREE